MTRPDLKEPSGMTARPQSKLREVAVLRELFPFIWPFRWVALCAGAALLIAAVAELAVGQALRQVVDKGFSPENAEHLDGYFLAMFAIIALMAVAGFGRSYLVSWLGERVVANIRTSVFNHVIGLSPSFFEANRTGEVLSRLTADTTMLQSVVSMVAPQALRYICLFVGGTALLIFTSTKLAAVVVVLVPVTVLPIMFVGRYVRNLARASQDGVANISAAADESLTSLQTVQAFTHEDRDRQHFADVVDAAFRIAVHRSKIQAGLTGTLVLCLFGAINAVLWIGAKDVVQQKMTGGELAAFVMYAIIVASSFGGLSESWMQIQRAAGAAQRLLELLRAEAEIRTPDQAVPLPSMQKSAITFDQACFRYPARPEVLALDGFTLSISPGETVALVGPSGSGKSTVFKLLLRFYDLESGNIMLDGVDIAQADPRAVRGRISFVSQDPVIFGADVSTNIAYGKPDATADDIQSAADAAAALEFIEALPDGFATFLGEKGTRLSGGQRQRIAIARAILRHASVLLFDEATSALDSESEQLVQLALERVAANRTTIVIAHRLSTVLKADRIIVMDKGQIVGQGTHQSLMRENGLYARLARLQFEVGAEALEPTTGSS